jgi:hypothetical protein
VPAPEPEVKLVEAQRTVGGQPYGHGDSTLELRVADKQPASLSVHWPSGYRQTIAIEPGTDSLEIVEPAWLTLEPRRVAAGASALLRLSFEPTRGVPSVERSDGLPLALTSDADGSYSATIEHPAKTDTIALSISVDGQPLAIRPLLFFE